MIDERSGRLHFARFAGDAELASMTSGHGPQLGYADNGSALRWGRDGPILTVAGARADKGSAVVVPISLGAGFGGRPPPTLLTDPSAQTLRVVARAQASLGRHVLSCDPMGLGADAAKPLRCNPLAHLKPGPMLFSDCATASEWLLDHSGGAEARFWEDYGRSVIAFAGAADTLLNGGTSIPSIWGAIQRMHVEAGYFEELLKSLAAHPDAPTQLMRDAAELFDMKVGNERGWIGLIATVKNAIGIASEPHIAQALGGSDFSTEVLSNPGLWREGKAPLVTLVIPGEKKVEWRAITRCFIGSAALHARRRTDRRIRPYFLIDEAGSLGPTPLIPTAMSEEAKHYQSHFLFQSIGQIEKNFGTHGARELISSAAVRQFFGIRDAETARVVSDMLGTADVTYRKPIQRDEHRSRMRGALRSILLDDVPIVETWLQARHEERQSRQVEHASRPLLAMSDLLSMPSDQQVIFVDHMNPVLARKRRYFEDPNFRGMYDPDPFHPGAARTSFWSRLGFA